MTYGAADFFGLLIIGWLVVFLLHQSIGGILSIFWRAQLRRHAIEIVNARNKI